MLLKRRSSAFANQGMIYFSLPPHFSCRVCSQADLTRPHQLFQFKFEKNPSSSIVPGAKGEAFDGDRFVLRPQHNPCSIEPELPPSLPPSKLTPMRRVSLNKRDCFASSPRRHLSNSNNTCPDLTHLSKQKEQEGEKARRSRRCQLERMQYFHGRYDGVVVQLHLQRNTHPPSSGRVTSLTEGSGFEFRWERETFVYVEVSRPGLLSALGLH